MFAKRIQILARAVRARSTRRLATVPIAPKQCTVAADLFAHRSSLSSSRTLTTFSAPPTTVLPLSPTQRQTIYALATAPGKAGVAIIRISGPACKNVYAQMVQKPSSSTRKPTHFPKPRLMERCTVTDPDTKEPLDDGLVVYFASPKSFTTEDVLELHVHSGRAIISSVLSALSRINGCRPADRGEFTRRAFEGGRLDLTQVEGLRDLIDAETASQRKLALRAAGGAIGKTYDDLRERIVYVLAMVEAIIDFGEGEEIEDGVWERAQEKVAGLKSEIRRHLDDGRRGEILRSGIRLAIFGPPNAGKSSLLNYLAQREAAIVTPLPGTTRDVLEITLDIGGLPVIVADTAGLRKTTDAVESIGIERAKSTIASSDISLCVVSLPELLSGSLHPSVTSLITSDTLLILNKLDLTTAPSNSDIASLLPVKPRAIWQTSVSERIGVKDFMSGFERVLRERFDTDSMGEQPVITQARHRTHLENALQYLEVFTTWDAQDVVLAAEELRYAAHEVGKVCGAIGVEDILDTVFKEFCIGK